MKIGVSAYQPFIDLLASLPEDIGYWTPTPQWAKNLIDSGLAARPLGELIGQNNVSDNAYLDAAQILKKGMSYSFSRNGKSQLTPPAAAFMDERAAAFLYPRLFDVCALVRCLDEAKPDLILVHNDVEPQTRAMCLWANSRNVPSLHVPHAVYQDVNRDGPGTDIHDLITASWLASAGPIQTTWYLERGFPDEQIIETGRPILDKWVQPQMSKKRARRLLRLPPKAPVVCYASTWTQLTNEQGANNQWIDAYHSFLAACKSLNVEGVVKCHPSGGQQNWNWHMSQAKQAGVPVTITPQHLEACLYASDLLVAFGGSNTIVEGAFVPELRLLSTHGYEGEPAVGRTPLDPDGMLESIEQSLSSESPDTSGLKSRWAGEPDGKATERVVNLIMELGG